MNLTADEEDLKNRYCKLKLCMYILFYYAPTFI